MSLLNGSGRAPFAANRKAVSGVCLAAACALLLAGRVETAAQSAIPPEYQVKAAFLFRFSQFTQWPLEAFAGAGSPLVIGILGEDPFREFLDDIVRGEQVQERPFVIQRYRRLAEMKTCHVLFISRSENSRIDQILAGLRDRPILTVCEVEGFTTRGGMIEFVSHEGKIRLRINPTAAKSVGLTISSKLLRPAEIVETGKG